MKREERKLGRNRRKKRRDDENGGRESGLRNVKEESDKRRESYNGREEKARVGLKRSRIYRTGYDKEYLQGNCLCIEVFCLPAGRELQRVII